MALERRSRFGFPPPASIPSESTVRLVPLTQGMRETAPWPLLPPGSAVSLSNYVPLEGKLIPRSRLSSFNTILFVGEKMGRGMVELTTATGGATVWFSGASQHGIISSNGSWSLASFISAAGLGDATLESDINQNYWQYAQTYLGSIDDYVMIAAGGSSHDTLHCLYRVGVAPKYSYLTGAPQALGVASFDNYIVAWNTQEGGDIFVNRARWCVRGEPDNWSGEGAGFEDLLEVRGEGRAVKPMADGRLILFTDREIWYGVRAAYPAQFHFAPLDTAVGCPYPMTIQETPAGYLFLGSDWRIRLLPAGGGLSQPIAPDLTPELRLWVSEGRRSWALYDRNHNLYYLYPEGRNAANITRGFVVNLSTNEWAYADYGNVVPWAGICLSEDRYDAFESTCPEGILLNDAGQYFLSVTSRADYDVVGSTASHVVTSTFRSPPLAMDLPGNWKQLLAVNLDYRATSRSTVTVKISGDGGNNYETTGTALSLASAPYAGRASVDVYRGGAFPALELTSTSTGYELHRLDVTLHHGGRA